MDRTFRLGRNARSRALFPRGEGQNGDRRGRPDLPGARDAMIRAALQGAGLLSFAALMLAGQLLIKQGLKQTGPVSLDVGGLFSLVPRIVTTPILLAGCLIGFLTTLLWLMILSRLELSYASPILTAIYFVLLLVCSRLVLHESVSSGRWLGVLLTIVGITLISRNG
ncbi:MAG: EamA family transporter [Holophagales bacterium]|nr:EamA family transporter [Holophagales bacterium]